MRIFSYVANICSYNIFCSICSYNMLQISNEQRIESLEFTLSCCIISTKEKELLMQLVE